MARSRETVQESLESLKQLEQQYREDPQQEVRIRMLRLLKEKPSRTLADVALLIHRSERSVQRWWATYQKEGIEALIEIKPAGGRKPKPIGGLELQDKTHTQGFGRLQEAQAWLQDHYGVRYSRSGMWYLMRTALNAEHGGWSPALSAESNGDGSIKDLGYEEVTHQSDPFSAPTFQIAKAKHPELRIPLHILEFLNALPTTGDILQWIHQFCEAFRDVLGDVSRVSLNVNVRCNLSRPQDYVPDTIISQLTSTSGSSNTPSIVSSGELDERPSERILENIRRQGHNLQAYHPPECYDYYFGGWAYLGSVILWRDLQYTAISDETLQIMERLEPFILFSLSDLVARHQAEKPVDRVFYDVIHEMVNDAGLSRQEKRIVILRLMGHSYKDLADLLGVTIDGVKKHLTQIHRKTATNGMAELFAKYFSSRLIPTEFKDDSGV